jgi:FkbM family methyltransferase
MKLHKSDLEDDIAAYIASRMPAYQMGVLVDCGANHGWFTYQFLKAFPGMQAHCIEPVPTISEELVANLSRVLDSEAHSAVRLHKLALSDQVGSAYMTNQPGVTVNRIVAPGGSDLVKVEVTTGDEFCRHHNISAISFLKIDCEGVDDKVLRGFDTMIAQGRVDFVQVEAAIGDATDIHIPLRAFEESLLPRGYRHFRFVNQASDGPAYLSRADVVFIRKSLAETYGRVHS